MKRLFLQIFAWLAILLGVGLMLQPTVSRYLTEQKSTKTVQKFVQAAEAAAPARPNLRRRTRARLPRTVRRISGLQPTAFCPKAKAA